MTDAHDQKRILIERALGTLQDAQTLDERESLPVDKWADWYDVTIPLVTDIKIIAGAMEVELAKRRGQQLVDEDAVRAPNAVVTPGVTTSGAERIERHRDRALGRHPAAVDEYVKTEAKAGRVPTKKGARRHIAKIAAQRSALKPRPTRKRQTPRPGQEHLLSLEKVADGRRRTDAELGRMVGFVKNFLKWVYLIPWLTIDRTRAGTMFTIDQDLRDICEGRIPRPALDGFTWRGFSQHLRAEITRRRKEAKDERDLTKWRTYEVDALKQHKLLDWIEDELARIP